MRRLLTALLAGTFLSVVPIQARAEPITLAILAAVGTTAAAVGPVGVGLITFALTTAASLTLSLVANAFKAKTPETAGPASGTDLNVQYGGNVPREVVFGVQVTAGHLIYTNVCGGSTNNILQCVFVLSDGQCDGINKMWVNGNLVTLVNDGTNHYYANELKNFANIPMFRVQFYDGSYSQSADGELIADANPPGRWTTNHRGRGVCYIVIRQYYSEELQLTGVPNILVELRGNKLYDPRKDSTNGGSGAHRWGIPATYEFSENPALIEYNFRRGIRVNGDVLVGMDTVTAADLITPMYVSAANDCEDAIPLLGGGTELRYRCGMVASADKQHSTTLDTIRQSMAGFTLERIGQFGPIAGVAQSSVFEFSDTDFLVSTKSAFSKYETRSNIATAVYGNFSDPAQKWAAVPFPPRINSGDDTLMGERLVKSLDLTQIASNAQAQRVAEIERRRSMIQEHGSQTLGADFIGIQPGDWGTYHSPYGDIIIQVVSLSLAGDDSVTFAWRRIASSVFSWTTAGELDPPAVPTGGGVSPRVTTVAGFAANPTQVLADSGLTLPALLCSWTPILDPTVARVDIEYRVQANPATVLTFQADSPSAGIAVISGSIQALTVYELRAKPIPLPDRTTTFTSWIVATSGSDQVVQKSLEALTTRVASFDAALRQLVSQTANSGLAELRDEINTMAAAIARVQAGGYVNTVEVKKVIEAREQAVSATVEDVRAVAVDATSAVADLSLSLTAKFGDQFSAAVTFKLGALATVDGQTIAMAGLTLNAQNKISGYKIYNNGVASDFDIETDFFRIGKSGVVGGAFVPVFTVDTVNGIPKVALRGDMLIDGQILARHMTAGSINVGTIIADNIIVRGHIVADTATRLDVAQNASMAILLNGATWNLVSLNVTSIGGEFLIISSVDLDADTGGAGASNLGAADMLFQVLIDGSVQRDFTAAGTFWQFGTNQIRWKGHFETSIKITLSAGSHTILLRTSNNFGIGITVYLPTIIAFEARR